MNIEEFENFRWHVMQAVMWACERESVRIKKDAGLPKPWTTNALIRDHRFCNVSRQDDRETVILNEKFFGPHADSPDLWFNAAVARWINWSETILKIGWTDLSNGYDADDMYNRMVAAHPVGYGDGVKFFTGAYLIRGCTSAKEVGDNVELHQKCKDKRYFLAHVVFPSIFAVGPPLPDETLEAYHTRLTKAKSHGSFMAGQQIADLKYYTMKNASDWKTWSPIGPGPVRFLNRMMDRMLEKQIPREQYYEEMKLFDQLFYQEMADYDFDPAVKALVIKKLEDAHDRDSNLKCETDKFIRLQTGGRVRSKYSGVGQTTKSII